MVSELAAGYEVIVWNKRRSKSPCREPIKFTQMGYETEKIICRPQNRCESEAEWIQQSYFFIIITVWGIVENSLWRTG